MVMKIKYGDNEVVIAGINPTQEMLEIVVSAQNVTFDTLKELQGYHGAIGYYEDDVLIIEYNSYNVDFNCIYVGDVFTVNLKRIGETEIELQKTKDALKVTGDALEELIGMVMGGMS